MSTRTVEVLKLPGGRFHHMTTAALDDLGEFSSFLDLAGGAATIKPRVNPRPTEFP